MDQDIVEGPQALGRVRIQGEDVLMEQAAVAETQRGDQCLTPAGLPGRELHPQEVAARKLVGQGDQVAPRRRPQLQHPAALRGGRLDPQQETQGPKVIRVGLGEGEALVGDLVIACQ